jgi:D-tyrosyl-tRNA(Tyr) deacylase
MPHSIEGAQSIAAARHALRTQLPARQVHLDGADTPTASPSGTAP